ncbi:hypothetical protein P4S72_05425 [Vibrio sp. PP-XX7]
MTVSAGGFTQPLRFMFTPVYRLRHQLDPSGWMKQSLGIATNSAAAVEPLFDRYLIAPVCRLAMTVSRWVSLLQGGDFRIYCIYIVITLIVLLFFPFELGAK